MQNVTSLNRRYDSCRDHVSVGTDVGEGNECRSCARNLSEDDSRTNQVITNTRFLNNTIERDDDVVLRQDSVGRHTFRQSQGVETTLILQVEGRAQGVKLETDVIKLSQFTHVVTNEFRSDCGRFSELNLIGERSVGVSCTRRLQHTIDEHEQVSSGIWEVCFTVVDSEFEGSCSTIKSSEESIATTQKRLRLRYTCLPTVVRDDRQVAGPITHGIFQPDATSGAADCLTCDLTVRGVRGLSDSGDVCAEDWEVAKVLKLTDRTICCQLRIDSRGSICCLSVRTQVREPYVVNAVIRIVVILSDDSSPTRLCRDGALEQVNQVAFVKVAQESLVSCDTCDLALDCLSCMYELIKFDISKSSSGDVSDVKNNVGDRTVDNITIHEVILQGLNVNRDTTTRVTHESTSRVLIEFDICLSTIALVEDHLTFCECTAINVDQHAFSQITLDGCSNSGVYTHEVITSVNYASDILDVAVTFVSVIT